MAEENKEDQPVSSDENFGKLQNTMGVLVSQVEELRQYTRLSWRNLGKSFALGMATGLGATVGLAILIAILSLIVKGLGGMPVIGMWIGSLTKYIHE